MIYKLENNEFLEYEGKYYLFGTYFYNTPKQYKSLYATDDTDKLFPLHKITDDQVADHFRITSHCEMNNMQYKALKIIDNKFCEIKKIIGNEIRVVSLKDVDAVWSKKYVFKNKEETIDIHYVKDNDMIDEIISPQFNYYLDENASNNKMLSFCGEFKELKLLENIINHLYDQRVIIKNYIIEPLDFDTHITLTIDNIEFWLNTSIWDIVTLSPADKKGNPYMVEILKYLRLNGLKEL